MSRKTTLNCPSGSLTAKGGAFCYQIPSGFGDTSSSATYPGSDPVRTAIQPTDSSGGSRDLIFVTSTTLDVDADTLSDALIKSSLNKALNTGSTGATNTPLVQTVVAGDRAFETSIKFADGVKQRYLLVFAGHARVSISCQYQNQQAQITSACAQVLKSLQIKYP